MGKIFDIDAATRATITDALDDIISVFGKKCRLVYPARWVACANCLPDPVGKKSSNVWRTGGPVPFSAGSICPQCQGKGQRAEEVSEEILLKIEWDPKKFWRPISNANVRSPASFCQTKGYVSDYPRLKRAEFLFIQLPIEPYVHVRMSLAGEPISPGNIVQDRYLIADWESKG